MSEPILDYANADSEVRLTMMGGPNPCGAYYPTSGPLWTDNIVEEKCWSKNPDRNYGSNTPQQGSGFCCDMFNRVNPDTTGDAWELGPTYSRFDTVVGTGYSCPGCGQHYYNNTPHEGFEYPATASSLQNPYWTDTTPCEVDRCGLPPAIWRPTEYVTQWSACVYHIDAGCTMNHSFGLIMGGNNPTVNIAHPGSPNGRCSSNCMQLGIGYWENVAAGEYMNPHQPGHFDDTIIYDGEMGTPDANGNSGPTGPKLIWAGFCPTQMEEDNIDLETLVNYNISSCPNGGPNQDRQEFDLEPGGGDQSVPGLGDTTSIEWDPDLGNIPQSVDYPFQQLTAGGTTYRGYLPDLGVVSPDNAWGLLSPALGGTESQPDSYLWARKSVWRVSAANDQPFPTSDEDAFQVCEYTSFGCTDPSFGSYNEDARLDCNGTPTTNTFLTSYSLIATCENINGDPGICWGPDGFACGNCIDPNTNTYYTAPTDVGGGSVGMGEYYDGAEIMSESSPNIPLEPGGCTQEMLNACGATGTLTPTAWNLMQVTRPSSWLYGGGAASIPDPTVTGVNGEARFWDKDGRNVLEDPDLIGKRPLCQCSNSGCLYPDADNYSPINTTDCSDMPAPTDPSILPYWEQHGDISCCRLQVYGCSDDTSDNYFCSIDLDGDDIPDNAQFCMTSDTGIPCWDEATGYNQDCDDNAVLMDLTIPNTNTSTGLFTVTIQNDGTCDMSLIPGCMDDGGLGLAGTPWMAPVFPGYAAMNFDPDATIHAASMCEFMFGCPDPLAQNVIDGFPVCPINVNMTGTIDEVVDYIYGGYGLTIDAAFVEDNLFPNIECCDYELAGEGPGCTDPNALNYNPLAGTDDGSCLYNIEGCTDPEALNFNPLATLDDSSCLYPGDYPVEGSNFLDGSEMEICREPLTKEEVLMNVCQPTEIQSEVFIERGKQSVFEPNQRLDEVKTIGGLKIYGYGFYNIKE